MVPAAVRLPLSSSSGRVGARVVRVEAARKGSGPNPRGGKKMSKKKISKKRQVRDSGAKFVVGVGALLLGA